MLQIEGITNTDKYIEIINENLEEAVLKMGVEEEFILQQDNDPKHTAKKIIIIINFLRIQILNCGKHKVRT